MGVSRQERRLQQMEGLLSVYSSNGASYYAVPQAASVCGVSDVDRPFTDHRPATSRREAAAPLPAAGAEALLFRRRLDGAPKLEAALLGTEGSRWKDGERARDRRAILEKVA